MQPTWEIDGREVDYWLREVWKSPLVGQLARIRFPWVATHRLVLEHWTFGVEQWDVMVVGDNAFTGQGWISGTNPSCVKQGVDRWVHTELGVTADVQPVEDEQPVGWSDPETQERHVFLSRSGGLAELTADGDGADWTTHRGRQVVGQVIVREWVGSDDSRDPLSARLVVEAWLAGCSGAAWSVSRGQLVATLRGEVSSAGRSAASAAGAGLDHTVARVLADPAIGPPCIGPML